MDEDTYKLKQTVMRLFYSTTKDFDVTLKVSPDSQYLSTDETLENDLDLLIFESKFLKVLL